MSADLAAMRPGYNNIADTLRTGGAPFPFRAGATSAKPNLIYPLVLGSSPESGVAYNNITCGSPGGGAPPDPPTLSNPFKGPSVGAGLPAPRVERNGEKERKERKEKGKGLDRYGGELCDAEIQAGRNGAGGTQKWSEPPRLCCYRRWTGSALRGAYRIRKKTYAKVFRPVVTA